MITLLLIRNNLKNAQRRFKRRKNKYQSLIKIVKLRIMLCEEIRKVIYFSIGRFLRETFISNAINDEIATI